jgi:hypothetical protein
VNYLLLAQSSLPRIPRLKRLSGNAEYITRYHSLDRYGSGGTGRSRWVMVWAIFRARGRTRAEQARTEAATQWLYDKEERARQDQHEV